MAENKDQYGKKLVHWIFPEFTQHKRGVAWYAVATFSVFGLLLYSFITSNFIFGFIIVLVVLILFSAQKNKREIRFQITDDGILVANKFYAYQDIENFWIIYNPPEVKKLYFKFKNWMSPALSVSLEDQNPVKIRRILLEYIEEDLSKEDEPISDQIQRMLKL